jgi:hypothetical protein
MKSAECDNFRALSTTLGPPPDPAAPPRLHFSLRPTAFAAASPTLVAAASPTLAAASPTLVWVGR